MINNLKFKCDIKHEIKDLSYKVSKRQYKNNEKVQDKMEERFKKKIFNK